MRIPDCENQLQELIGYRFRDGELLQEALTHRSWGADLEAGSRRHNERLEFLGDAVLDLAVSQMIFEAFPGLDEGEMTRVRAEVVSERSLSLLARRLRLGSCLHLGRGEERTGGREKNSLLADGLEALLGGVFLEGGLEAAAPVVERLFRPAVLQSVRRKAGRDHKTRLQEKFQGEFGRPPEYVLVLTEGPDHEPWYTVEVRFDGAPLGRGRGRTKKQAAQEAARAALERPEGEE